MAFPIAVAIDEAGSAFVPPGAAFVTDQFNNRVRVFRPDGSLLDLPHPIGTPENPLSQPEGIAIDAAHQIIVSDSYNSSVNVYGPDGAFRYRIWIDGIPTGVAISPGATLTGDDGSSLNTADHAGTLVITDKFRGIVHVYDANGAWLRTLGGLQSDAGDGSFVSPAGVAFDRTGRHFIVADLDSAWTQIYNADGTRFELQFASNDGRQRSYAAAFDHLGRAVVSDTVGQRVVFYAVDFTNKRATQLFQLDARGDLNGFPRGVAEWTVPDPDRAGLVADEQLFVVDTTNHRVQRFQVPALATLDVNIVAPTTPTGVGTVTFNVAVPITKPPVAGVVPSLSSIGATISGPLEPTGVPIGSGETATFSYTYARATAPASFVATAMGDPIVASENFPDGYATHSNARHATEEIRCQQCSVSASVRSPAASPSGWYRGETVVHLKGTGATANVQYRFENCPQAAYTHGTQTLGASGGDVLIWTEGRQRLVFWAVDAGGAASPRQTLDVNVDFTAPYFSFSFPTNFTNTPDGLRWYNRNTTPVTAAWQATDSTSGLPGSFRPAPLVFSSEGRGQSIAITQSDIAGNSTTLRSNDGAARGSMDVNIDLTPPVLTVPPYTIVVDANIPTGLALGQVPSLSALIPGLAASDPPLTSGAPGSGIASIAIQSGPSVLPLGRDTSISLSAVDHAGNVSAPVSRTVRVVAPGTPRPVISVALEPSVLSPANHRLVDIRATVAASDSTGIPPVISLVSIVSSEPDSGTGGSDVAGDIQDAAYGTLDTAFKLRAERADNSSSRVYTVTYRASNAGGAVTYGSATVVVPAAKDSNDDRSNDKEKDKEKKKADPD